jgi:hypothetical protein
MSQSLYEIALWTDGVQKGTVHMEYIPRVGEHLYFQGQKRHIKEVIHVLKEHNHGGNDCNKVLIILDR